MKKLSYIISALLLLSLTSCEKWLDINDNPSKASDVVPTPDLRLRSIQMQFVDAYESSGTRASWITQNITKIGANATNDLIARWNFPLASATWPYQAWFVYTASNLEPMIEKATAEEAWHYVGAAQLIHAWGFMLMLDLYGEMPYTHALGSDVTPEYDDGETIFYGCLEMLENAIENLSKTQPAGATPLSGGDIWNGGDPGKWIKLAYGLKARWLNNLSKKSFYDPEAVLAALENAPQSNSDNTVMDAINTSETQIAGIVRSMQHGNLGGTANRMTKWYTDLLTNTFTGGSGVMDPRTTRIIPSAEFYNSTTGEKEWRLSKGVDMINSDIRTKGGPVAYEIMAARQAPTTHPSGYVRATAAQRSDAEFTNRWFTTNATADRQGDSVYISVYSDRLDWIAQFPDPRNDNYIASRYNGMTIDNPNFNSSVININSTGSFYIRADAPAHLLTYHEMCFIKAEVLFRKGDLTNALTAYKAGIRAHMEAMNEKLREYPQDVYGKEVISETEIATFLASAAVAQNPGQLTMAKIMQQKQIAMSLTMQNWNDMRRFDYAANHPQFGVVYPDFGRPFEFDAAAAECYPSSDPQNPRYWPRRIQQCSHEINYNAENWLASNPEAQARTILSYPVWWDTVE
ncbi:SusD/RagB family nutrient-binding outer membrane lipoprotein [Olivibacter sitiensis]|uniref:SusD/RagB family nutrient-binding outer membrane lipoprotein n=1 Tax=Olivibacter sitiensis TaxID=376470 RepID=UPI000425D3D5|nr:SusD/RagB family nutrient-binding outer membrane lipoprotein [Olivibacter sitiensis]